MAGKIDDADALIFTPSRRLPLPGALSSDARVARCAPAARAVVRKIILCHYDTRYYGEVRVDACESMLMARRHSKATVYYASDMRIMKILR